METGTAGANLDAGAGQPGFVARYGLGAGDDSRDEVAAWVWNIATVKFPEATWPRPLRIVSPR